MNTSVETKLSEIANCMASQIDTPRYNSASLYTGDMGKAIFFAYYNRYRQDQQSDSYFDRTLERSLEVIGEGFYYAPYCGGVSGALYGLKYLIDNKFLDMDTEEAMEAYFPYLKNEMLKFIKEGNYDFMHGAIGIALHFIKCGREENYQACIELVDELEKTAIKEGDTLKWTSENLEKEKIFNIAMSHGMSSIAVFLSRMINANIDIDRCTEMLCGTMNYILQQQFLNPKAIGSYFPFSSLEHEIAGELRKSRMAWCYGDLGVAAAIWQAGKVLNNNSWKQKAIEVFEFAAERRSLPNEQVMDAGICHGTAGIAHIFLRMYIETGNEKFALANSFWIEETLKMARWEEGFAGYMSWSGADKDKEWEPEDSFLEGITGVGLSLLAYLKKDDPTFSDWDEILLIS